MNASTVIACATVLSTFIPLPAQSADGQAERVVQSVPVGYILADYEDPRPPLLGSFINHKVPIGRLGSRSLLEEHSNEAMISLDALGDIVRALSGDEFSGGTASLDTTGNSLLVTGSAEAVRRARRVTEELGRNIGRPIHLEVALYRSSGSSDYPGVLGAGELDRLTNRLELLWKGSSITRSGRQVALGRERYTHFIGDVDVEVAQKAKIGDPKTFQQFEGLRIVAEPHALSDGDDLVVFCQYAIGDRRGEIQSRSTGVDKLPSLDVPLLATASGGMSARIQSGQALILSLGGANDGGDNLLLTVAASLDDSVPSSQSNFTIFSVSALTSNSMGARVSPGLSGLMLNDYPFTDYIGATPLSQDSIDFLSVSELEDLCHDLLGDRIDAEQASITSIGGYLVVSGQASDRNRILSFLRQQENLNFDTLRVRIETRRQQLEKSNRTFSARGERDGPGEVLHAVSFPALVGRPHFAMRGLESTGISDFDVEIAQKSEQANPVIEKVFSGVICSLTPERWSDGMAADIKIRLIDGGDVKRRALEADFGGDLYLHSPTLTNFQHDGPLPESGVLSLGDGPIIRSQTQNWQTTQSIQIGGC